MALRAGRLGVAGQHGLLVNIRFHAGASSPPTATAPASSGSSGPHLQLQRNVNPFVGDQTTEEQAAPVRGHLTYLHELHPTVATAMIQHPVTVTPSVELNPAVAKTVAARS